LVTVRGSCPRFVASAALKHLDKFSVALPLSGMNALTLHRIDPARNMRRFYRLDVQPDLFGLWLLMREWGRIGRPGQTREDR
jgi:hypothetical protein